MVSALDGLLPAALPAQAAHAATTAADTGFESGSTGWSAYSAGGRTAASFTEANSSAAPGDGREPSTSAQKLPSL